MDLNNIYSYFNRLFSEIKTETLGIKISNHASYWYYICTIFTITEYAFYGKIQVPFLESTKTILELMKNKLFLYCHSKHVGTTPLALELPQ